MFPLFCDCLEIRYLTFSKENLSILPWGPDWLKKRPPLFSPQKKIEMRVSSFIPRTIWASFSLGHRPWRHQMNSTYFCYSGCKCRISSRVSCCCCPFWFHASVLASPLLPPPWLTKQQIFSLLLLLRISSEKENWGKHGPTHSKFGKAKVFWPPRAPEKEGSLSFRIPESKRCRRRHFTFTFYGETTTALSCLRYSTFVF